jgi:ATP-dependent helicase HrpB
MQEFPAHPRLAHMLLKARELGAGSLAAELAALLSDRDLLRAGAGRERDSDIRTRLEALRRGAANVDRGALDRVRRAQRAFEQQLQSGVARRAGADVEPGVLLAFAYPDRIARRRAGADARYQMSNGRGAVFPGAESLARQEFIVAVDLDDREREARIHLAAPLSKAELLEFFADHIHVADEQAWDDKAECVIARRATWLDELLIEEKPLNDAPRDTAKAAMLDGIRKLGLEALPWDDDIRDYLARIELLRTLGRPEYLEFPASDTAALDNDLAWLEPFLDGVTRRAHLARVPLMDALRARLRYDQQRTLDEQMPTHITLPTGTRTRIAYRDPNAPIASMRMQEVFGLAATPRIGGGALPVTFELLSPGRTPLQVTRDLASFWKNAYVEVRKDMRGRYPRHYWPENPLEAEPTRRAKPRGT